MAELAHRRGACTTSRFYDDTVFHRLFAGFTSFISSDPVPFLEWAARNARVRLNRHRTIR
jgi:hypothetical protein